MSIRSSQQWRKVAEPITHEYVNVGAYLAHRLVEAGARKFFTVPGDFILALLDELLKREELQMIGCCNELNAGYATDGYCRESGGLGVAVVTYCVGGLSIINAVAGAYSEDLPLLIISGGPNTHDEAERRLVHHTIGEHNLYQASAVFEPVVCRTFVTRHISDAVGMIDDALTCCLRERKPVYLEIACNLVTQKVPAPSPMQFVHQRNSDPLSLKAAARCILDCLLGATRPVMVVGVRVRVAAAAEQLQQLACALQCGVAVMPDAKSLFPETHPQYMGVYWAGVSSMHVSEVVESSDLSIFVGPIFNDGTTTGWNALINYNKVVELYPHFAIVCSKRFSNVQMADLLAAVAMEVPARPASLQAFHRYQDGSRSHSHSGSLLTLPQIEENELEPNPLTLSELKRQLQQQLTARSSVVVEAGVCWFLGQQLQLPEGAKYHVQMLYCSIGWSVGACLGVALAADEDRRGGEGKEEGDNEPEPRHVIALIGDGSFQMSAQELSTMIRQGVRATIILLNNRGYTIEVVIHDGPYNDIQNWDYAGLVDVLSRGTMESKQTQDTGQTQSGAQSPIVGGMGLLARSSVELTTALARAKEHRGLSLIECVVARDDYPEELLEWGSRLGQCAMRV